MSDTDTPQDQSKEEAILKMVKRVLTDIAKDTHVKPGLKHPLSDSTIQGIRDCLALITARESEIAGLSGRENKLRPRFADEPQRTVVVPIEKLQRKKDDS